MTNENQATAPESDPLAMPGSTDETDYPLLKPNKIYRFSVKSIELVESKSEDAPVEKDGTKAKNAKIQLSTTKEELDVKDNVLHVGYVISKYIPMYPTEKRTMADVRRDLLTFIFAVEGKNSKTPPSAIRDTSERFVGKLVDGKVSISEDKSGQYGPSNGVRFVIPD